MRWFLETRLIIIWLITTLEIGKTFQSEILIIRHGRSRSRHSVEKDHVRWGLQALDNLTIVGNNDVILETAENEINGELNVVSFYENNGTLSQSSELNGTIGSYEINYTHSPSSKGGGEGISLKKHYHEWYHQKTPQTTDSPKSVPTTPFSPALKSGRRRNGRKKEIMTNIKNTVNKGIQYLKSHENLDEIKIEINDPSTRRTVKSNKIRYQPIVKKDQISSSTMLLKQQQQKQQQKLRKTHSTKQIKINGGRELGIVTIVTSERNEKNKIKDSTLNPKNPKKFYAMTSSQQRHATAKHIKNHQSRNQLDLNINSNLADVFYIPTSTEENKVVEGDDGMQGDEPSQTSKKITVFKQELEKPTQEISDQQHQKLKIPKSHPETSSSDAPIYNRTVDQSNKSLENVQQSIEKATFGKIIEKEENRANMSHELTSPLRVTDGKSMKILESNHHNDEMNNDDETNEEFFNAMEIQNDEISNENILEDVELDETSNLNGIYNVDDLDLTDFDETSRNNRKNLMRGRDVVTRFLQIVESQHHLGGNCTAGTALNLGEGVVDQYAQDRFRIEAEVAVNRANMLTRIFKLTPLNVQENINLLQASVLSMVEFDDDIFAAGHCFDWNQYSSKKGLFCPFAHRLPPPEVASFAKDLASEYHYLGNTSEWFFLARKNAERVIAKNEQYIKAYHSYSNESERHAEEILSVKYEDGRWSKPYYDCGGGNIWMLTYTVPFFGYDNGTYFFKGTSGIDIDLRRVDIDQCPQKNIATASGIALPLNIFAGTDKCKQRTTECVAMPGLGFRRGSYKCICRRGFYYPDVRSIFKHFNGSTLEEEYAKLMQNEVSFYTDPNAFECLPCAEGCDSCEDASPCVAELNWPMRTSILILACAIIGFLPPAAVFTFRYQQVKVVKAASPALLRVIAIGAFLIYCTTIVMYPPPSIYTCVAKIWLREIGFSLTYGALMLKTWRISVIFRVRSAKAVKITDASLIKKLGLLCGFVSVALLVRTLVSPPDVIVGRTADNLKAFLCKTDWWDHTFTSLEVLFLAWGVRLCIVVRKAPSEFNESRFISMAIYNEFLLTCFLNVSMLFLQSPANPDLLYIIFFCHTQLTVTLLLALIFGSKVYLVFRNGGKSLEDSIHNKSTATKFVNRSQPRTYASVSSANASTGQLHYQNGADNRLSENEAVEEIKQLTKQLQNLYDRIPQRGPATNVILTLLDICRTSQANNSALLKPPPPHEQAKKLSICNGNSCGASIDKGTNTSFENLVWQQLNDANSHSMISDKCDNDNLVVSESIKPSHKSKCCEANNKTTTTINCSSTSINFDNLKLQCMCSSDNSSLEEYQIENCDNCCASERVGSPNKHQCGSHPGESFRERLLNLTQSNMRPEESHSNNLRKRNSELVLGTNFESSSLSATSVYKGSQSYRISCDNIFSDKPPAATTSSTLSNNRSNHSLSTESDHRTQIPYSFLERPSMKLSQSEDKNLRELKIALSSSLSSANKSSNSNGNKNQLIGNLKSLQITTQQSQFCTSSSSTSSKIDRISFSLSGSSTSDVVHSNVKKTHEADADLGAITDEANNQQEFENINNECEDSESVTALSKVDADDKSFAPASNVNSVNKSNNGNGKKRRTPESKLAIDLNDRSKYTEEVSV